jgi:hypothetical protein
VALGQADDFAKELLVDLAEDVGRDDGKRVRAVRIVEVAQDVAEELVVEIERQRQLVGILATVLFPIEVEEAGVLASVSSLEQLTEARVDAVAIDQGAQAAVVLEAAVLADAQEDDPVDNPLNGKVEFALGAPRVAERKVAGQFGAPAFDLRQKGGIDLRGAPLAPG